MKKIGIIFALKEEFDETKKLFNNVVEHKLYELTIYECVYKSVTCYLVESGMGKVNAARTTQVLIDNMNVDYILNVGVAGSVSKNINYFTFNFICIYNTKISTVYCINSHIS